MPRVILSHEPVGSLKHYAGGTVPSSYLQCDGSAVSRTTYASLFAAVGTTYGAGDGTTTFNLPDFRGRLPMGDGAGGGLTSRTVGQSVGAETHTIGTSNLPAHSHDISHTHGSSSVSGSTGTGSTGTGTSGSHAHVASNGAGFLSDGAGGGALVAGSSFPAVGSTDSRTVSIPSLSVPSLSISGTAAGQSLSASSGNGPGTGVSVNHVNPALVVKFMIRY